MLLSDIAGSATVPATQTSMRSGGTYTIKVLATGHLILAIAHRATHRGWTFDHPNVVATRDRLIKCRRYYPSGAKRWFAYAGVERLLVVPLDRITLDLDRSGLSYIGVTIGGKAITLSVSGGTDGQDDWMDVLTPTVSTCIDLPISTLKAIARTALTPADCRSQGITLTLEDGDETTQRHLRMLLSRHHLVPNLRPGMTVIMNQNYTVRGHVFDRAIVSDGHGTRPKHIDVMFHGHRVETPLDAIDWITTADACGRQMFPRAVNHLAAPPAHAVA